MDQKPFYTSKTLWFNLLAVAVFVAGSFGYADFLPDPDLLALAAAVLNLGLRFATRQPVSLRPPGRDA